MVGGELPQVLADALLPVRQVNRPALRQSDLHRRHSLLGSRAGGDARLLTQQVPVQRITHLSDGQTLNERFGPPVLPDNVIDQLAHVPVRTRRPRRP